MKKAVLRAVFPGVFCVISFSLFAALYTAIAKDVLYGYLKWYVLVIGAVFILPSVIFFFVARQAYLGRISGIKATVICCVISVVFGMICLTALFWIGFLSDKYENEYTSDPADYPEKYELSSVVHGIFPEEIPANAENVIFDYCPPSWQGERHLMLMYDTDESEIVAVEKTGDFVDLWEVDTENRKKLRILLSSYFGVESTPNDKINVNIISGVDLRNSTVIAVFTMPELGKVGYIYYID